MQSRKLRVPFLLAGAAILASCGGEPEPPQLSYAQDIEPIVNAKCLSCHLPAQEGTEASGLMLDSYENLMKGTKFGPVVVPGAAASSTLYLLVAGKADPSLRMPHGQEPLTDPEIESVRVWIDQGAVKD